VIPDVSVRDTQVDTPVPAGTYRVRISKAELMDPDLLRAAGKSTSAKGPYINLGVVIQDEGDYFGRYFGLLFDRLIGADYEKGLARLKALAERASAPAAAPVS